MSFLKPVSERDFCSVDNTIIMLCLVVEDVRDSEHVNRVTLYVEITLYKIDVVIYEINYQCDLFYILIIIIKEELFAFLVLYRGPRALVISKSCSKYSLHKQVKFLLQ